MIHGSDEYANAVSASKMLFGNSTSDELRKLDEKTFLAVFSGVPTFDIQKSDLPCDILDFLAVKTQVFPSKGEAKKMVQGNGVSINKDKVADIEHEVSEKDIVDGKYILAQKGKKNYFIINVFKYGETGKHKTAQGRQGDPEGSGGDHPRQGDGRVRRSDGDSE